MKQNENDKRIVDIHTHILSGVDDGSKSMEETLQMLKFAYAEGITDIIVTPHYQSGRFYTPISEILKKIAEIQRKLQDTSDVKIRLYPGTEIYYRSGLEERLDKGDVKR